MGLTRHRGLASATLSRVAGGRTGSGADGTGSGADGTGSGADRPAASPRDIVLLVGFDASASDRLRAHLAGHAEVIAVRDPTEGLAILVTREIAVLCLGEELAAGGAKLFLDRAWGHAPVSDRRDLVLAAGSDPTLFQDLVDGDQLYYLTQRPPPLADVERLLRSALTRDLPAAGEGSDSEDEAGDWALGARSILELAGRLAMETRVDRATRLTAQEAERLLRADHATCLIHDPEEETLWQPPTAQREPIAERDSAAAGLVGFVARTGSTIQLERVGADPRHDSEADNDDRSPDERFLAAPISSDEQVLAVIVVSRLPTGPPFSEADLGNLELLARQVAPAFDRLALAARLAEQTAGAAEVFRREAVEHHIRGFADRGHPLQISPGWIQWVFQLLLLVFVSGLLFSVLGSIREYASGPAVVYIEDRSDITAKRAGTVDSVEISAGQRVAAGDLMVRFHGAQEAGELDRIEREIELGLIQRLRDPGDRGVARTLSALRAQKQLAEARLEERSLRAPHAGIVSDLRVRPGQHLMAGQILLTLIGEGQDLGIVALFPGRYRPLIRPGMELRLELEGYRYAYQHLVIDSLSDEVVGPAEARRILGAGIGDAVPLNGSLVWVRARLPEVTFESEGRLFRFHDGIQGTAEVQVRSEKILTALLPGLKGVLRGSHD